MATMKTITVVSNKGEPHTFRLSTKEEFSDLLSYFQAFSLKDDEGALVIGFPSLESGRTYTPQQVGVGPLAPYPPSTSTNTSPSTPTSLPELPPSPPRNGILNADFVLAREDLVSRIVATGRKITIIRSPPATGKTSLLDLIQKSLRQRDNASVVRMNCCGQNGLLQQLERHLGVSLSVLEEVHTLRRDTWILIDDAQLNFDDENLWKVVIKDLENMESNRIHIIIAATYDLTSQGTTPYHFAEYPHVSNLILTPQEAESLYDGLAKRIFFAEGWLGFKDTLLRLAGGHVGVLSGGISMIHRIYVDRGNRIEESDALNALRDHRFRVNLNRCFPFQELMQDDQREAVGRTIVSGPQSVHINASQGSSDPPALVQLVRAGILSSDGSFSCLAAQWQYFNFFFSRPAEAPAPDFTEVECKMRNRPLEILSPNDGGKSSSSNPFPTSLLEATLQQRQRSLQQRLRSSNPTTGNNSSWERETVHGINHSFGLYKLCVPTYTNNNSCGWTEEEVVIQEECTSIAARVWDNATLTVKWLQHRLDDERQKILQQQNQNNMISMPETLVSILDWDSTTQTDNAASSPRHQPIQVLELGSGMGLLSITLAKIGAAVMATEYGSENVKHLQTNCKNNGVLTTDTTTKITKITTTMEASSNNILTPGRVYCRELDWYTTQETIDSLKVGIFNLIVVTDCSLSQKDSDGVMDMILRYGTPGETKAIVGLCKEREGTPHFVERAKNEFHSVRTVSESEYHPDYRSKRHALLLINV